MKSIRSERGQVLLIVVLTMIVALTVGLSIASRTITNLKISKQNEESQRAFQAAEAGVEQALKQIKTANPTAPSNSSLGNNAGYSTTISPTSGNAFLLNGGDTIDQDSGLDVWLSTYPTYTDPMAVGSTVTVFWGDPAIQPSGKCQKSDGNAIVSALEIVILSGNTSAPTLSKYVFDPCNRILNASASGSGGSVLGTNFSYNTGPIPVGAGLIMKIIPVYNSTKMGITATTGLPSQGSTITSTGTSGDTVRKVVYFSSYPQIPLEIFPYTLIAQ